MNIKKHTFLHTIKQNTLRNNICESLYANAASNTITAIRCTSGLPLLLSLLSNELQKPASKPEKSPNWVIPFFLSPSTSGSGATRGRRKILNPPRSLRIWREPVRKQRRGVDYDDRENNVRGGVRVPPNGRVVSRVYCTPKRDP